MSRDPSGDHWAKLAVGKAEPPRPLPEARPGELLADVTTSEASLDAALDLANDLFNALHSVGHRVVIASSDSALRRARIDEREARSTERNYYHHNGLWSPQRPTVVYVGTVAIGLAIVEMSAEVLLRYVNGKYIHDADYIAPRSGRYAYDHTWTTSRELPSGRFRSIAYSPYSRVDWAVDWQDGPKNSLRSSLRSIARAIQEAAIELVPKLEEAERRAAIAHQEWLASQERYRREEDRRQVEKSNVASQQHLADVIQEWAKVISVDQFFANVEQRSERLPETERAAVLGRLRLAREFMGSQNPLDFFLAWKTPNERYQPKYGTESTS